MRGEVKWEAPSSPFVSNQRFVVSRSEVPLYYNFLLLLPPSLLCSVLSFTTFSCFFINWMKINSDPHLPIPQSPTRHSNYQFFTFPLSLFPRQNKQKMPRRRTNKTVKAIESVPEPKELLIQTQQHRSHFMDHEIEAMERQIGAIRAIREVKIEHLLTELRLLRSRFSEEQLQKPVLEVFQETLPNLSIVNDKGSNKFEVAWKDKESTNNCAHLHASLLQRLSITSIPPLGGAFEYSSNAGFGGAV